MIDKEALKKQHKELMAQLPTKERAEVQAKIDKMIDEAREKSDNPEQIKDFMKEIYG